MTAQHIVSAALADTAQQLWGRAVASECFRVVTSDGKGGLSEPDVPWQTIRTFDAIGRPNSPELLVERGSSQAVARSLLAYRHLRTWRPQAARIALGASARAGFLPGSTLRLQRHRDAEPASPEPLAAIEASLGQPFLTHIGVRRGANAKATAQLFSAGGEPVGYAKVAWNELTMSYVRTEARRLIDLNGRAGPIRVPGVAATGDSLGMPFVVTAPMPPGVRRLRRSEDLSVLELCSLAPIDRIARPGTSRQLANLLDRLAADAADPVVHRVRDPLLRLAHKVGGEHTMLPILRYDHGDLVPWNACRDRNGELWLWDWELSEDDAIGGTDIVHWFVHAVHGPTPSDLVAAVADAGQRSVAAHRALGMGATASRIVTAAYALNLGERASALARSHRSWARNRIGEDVVLELARFGLQQLEKGPTRRNRS